MADEKDTPQTSSVQHLADYVIVLKRTDLLLNLSWKRSVAKGIHATERVLGTGALVRTRRRFCFSRNGERSQSNE